MPTERFCRLPEKKQQVIYDAAMEEFARVPFEKASINRIIQNARISRGSFYTYFQDKQDLLRYVTGNKLGGISKVCADAIKETNGDYFAVIERVFEYLVTESQRTTQMLDFLRNVMSNREVLQTLGFTQGPPSPILAAASGGPMEQLYDRVDHSKFRFDDPGDYVPMMTMAASALIISVLSFYNYPAQLEQIRKNFHTSLEILKNGCYKSEDEAGGDRV